MTSAPHNRPQSGARTLYDAQHNRVAVAAPHFAAGGAGTVHRIAGQDGMAAKLWRPGKTPGDAEGKIQYMIDHPVNRPAAAPFEFGWPKTLLYDRTGAVGFTMPFFGDTPESPQRWASLFNTYHQQLIDQTGAQQGNELDVQRRTRIAQNLAQAFRALHAARYAVGDINEKGILVTRNDIIGLIDCDTYIFTDPDPNTGRRYDNAANRPEFQAPESHAHHHRGRTPLQDRFGLACLIFRLLTGQTPFRGRIKNPALSDVSTDAARITNGLFPPSRPNDIAMAPAYREAWDLLTDEHRELFTRAFSPEHRPNERPRPEEWIAALETPPAEKPAPPAPAPTPNPA